MQEESPNQAFNRAKEILQQAILRDYPNPERKGCPGQSVLKQLASFSLPPANEPDWHHVTHCSPCYAEFLEYRAIAKAAERKSRYQKRIVLATAAALVILVGIATLWNRSQQGRGISLGSQPPGSSAVATSAFVDLESVGALRGNEENQQKNTPTLRIGYLDLRLRLPIGSEDGQYELQILKEPGQAPVAATQGTSVLENHSVFLNTRLDIRHLTPGTYYLAVRRLGSGWIVSPIQLRGSNH